MMTIETNIDEVIEGLGKFEKKQVPYALAMALNDVAFEGMESLKNEVRSSLNIRKANVPNAFKVKRANKNNLKAELFLDDTKWQYKVLAHHFTGGDRARKGLEKAMIYLGHMTKNDILTPPPGVKLKPSIYNKIIAQLKLQYKAGYSVNETKKSKARKSKNELRFFLATSRTNLHLAMGIYARMPGHNKPVCILRIAERPDYYKQLDIDETIRDIVERNFRKNFKKQLQMAVANTALRKYIRASK